MTSTTARTWIDVFDRRANEAGLALTEEGQRYQLHQVAGWHDITDESLWREYVLDSVRDLIGDGDAVFEAGCGVLAYLTIIANEFSNVDLWGVDGSPAAIHYARNMAAEIGVSPSHFSVGTLPECLQACPSDHYDITICHSVMQYLASEALAEQLVGELIRMTKPGGWIHLGDIRDAARFAQNAEHARKHWGGNARDLPALQYFDSGWFRRFEPDVRVSWSRSGVPSFGRQTLRFNITLQRRSDP